MAANIIIFSNGADNNTDIMLTGSIVCSHAVRSIMGMAAVLK